MLRQAHIAVAGQGHLERRQTLPIVDNSKSTQALTANACQLSSRYARCWPPRKQTKPSRPHSARISVAGSGTADRAGCAPVATDQIDVEDVHDAVAIGVALWAGRRTSSTTRC